MIGALAVACLAGTGAGLAAYGLLKAGAREDRLHLLAGEAGFKASPSGQRARKASSPGLGLRAVTAIGIGAAGVLIPGPRPLMVGLGFIMGWVVPGIPARVRLADRSERIQRAFPGVVDLLVICAESGLNLFQSLQAVTCHTDGPLAEELRQSLREVAVGRPLSGAVRSMAERVALPDVSSFASAIAQAEELGTPVAETFRAQARAARTAFRQRIEARISSVPFKMTACMVIFFLPALFVLLVLPNVLALLRAWR